MTQEEVVKALRALTSTLASLLVLIESLPDDHEAKKHAAVAQHYLGKITGLL